MSAPSEIVAHPQVAGEANIDRYGIRMITEPDGYELRFFEWIGTIYAFS